jgi:hypothetical protein
MCGTFSANLEAVVSWKRQHCFALALQACAEQVEALEDTIEVAKRQTQERELRSSLTSSEGASTSGALVAAPWPNACFDASGAFVIFPYWRGIAVASVDTGKVSCLLKYIVIGGENACQRVKGYPAQWLRSDCLRGLAASPTAVFACV